ncbi:MAG: sulfurtransferase TusA family protein [Bacteroides sp.]|nr:sulfurtransferase TusA family protein [Bacteroides sp.]MCD8079465.1 sulfurtransferase TusA family protein [Bacteroides sp.]
MTTIDTRDTKPYSPLIPAVRAMYELPRGEELQILTDDPQAFDHLKSYLSEQQIGFREIYDEAEMILQFTMP